MAEVEIHKKAWEKVAKDSANNSSSLNLALFEDLIDRQRNAIAQKTFSFEVKKVMGLHGDENEAYSCALIRKWYVAEDSPGLSAFERCRRWLNFKEWLLNGVKFNEFPPHGNHIKLYACTEPYIRAFRGEQKEKVVK